MNWEEGRRKKEEGRRKKEEGKHLIVDIECARCVPYLSLRAFAKQSHK
ncbi:hypothetical protein QUB75_13555 [Microcoleus sp. K1-B6]